MNKALALFKSLIGKDSTESISPLMRWLNPTLLKAEEGQLEFSYVIREEMTNPMGILHGGTTAAIIDDAIGAAVYSLGNTHAYTTVNLVIDYFSAAKAGDTIFAKTSIVKRGNKIMNAECEIWNGDCSRMVAKGHSNLIKTAMQLA
ncbi:PaaI family thioesterase [Aggregatimonas sangjinii]|uniref:PaaI family thioesterase n=1 Tax=Aggregatimonas sangjinii TaxID=2583587 RepID=A0A5B7SQQ3_9FLAO|nr:PaaI family thioesterase [Aggregatimonas sangjinii]QCW99310.1 PaaI family thioesterase [Aggregatimonas sangjinii]